MIDYKSLSLANQVYQQIEKNILSGVYKAATALIKRQPSIQKLTFSEILLTRPSPASKTTSS